MESSGAGCQNLSLFYTALFVGTDYCYGDGENLMTKPSGSPIFAQFNFKRFKDRFPLDGIVAAGCH